MKEKILQLVDAFWKFDNEQQPISSWHDKQDLLKEIEKLFEPAVVKPKSTIHDIIGNLFNELNLKHNKGEGEILLQYQDNTIFVLEQDLGDLKILEELFEPAVVKPNSYRCSKCYDTGRTLADNGNEIACDCKSNIKYKCSSNSNCAYNKDGNCIQQDGICEDKELIFLNCNKK